MTTDWNEERAEGIRQEFRQSLRQQWANLQIRLREYGDAGHSIGTVINNAVLFLGNQEGCTNPYVGISDGHYQYPADSVMGVTFYIRAETLGSQSHFGGFFTFGDVATAIVEAGRDLDNASTLFGQTVYNATFGRLAYEEAFSKYRNAVAMPKHPLYGDLGHEAREAAREEMFRLRPEVKTLYDAVQSGKLDDLSP